MAFDNKKQYNNMENVLQSIMSKYVRLVETQIERNNKILEPTLSISQNQTKGFELNTLESVEIKGGILGKLLIIFLWFSILDKIISGLKKDVLFGHIYRKLYYGGSYYDGLRIKEPNEYDIDLLFTLPTWAIIERTNKPGYVYCKTNTDGSTSNNLELYRKFLDGEFFSTNLLRNWLKGLLVRVLNSLPQVNKFRQITIEEGVFNLHVHDNGPALTLVVYGNEGGDLLTMEIDLVPCFVIDAENWPAGGYRHDTTGTDEFFIIPKSPLETFTGATKFWRLSFQKQEGVLIWNKQRLKPVVKLLKLMRDQQNHHDVKSYYLKTIILWMLETKEDEFWNNSLSYVFMTALKEYQKSIEGKKIQYFWNKKFNLISHFRDERLIDLSNRLRYIISKLEQASEDRYSIAKFFIPSEEVNKLQPISPECYNETEPTETSRCTIM